MKPPLPGLAHTLPTVTYKQPPATAPSKQQPELPASWQLVRDAVGERNRRPALLALARSASPVHAVSKAHAAPLFTAHGRRDRLIAFAQAERLHRRLQEMELPTTFRPVDRAGHGFGPDLHREAIRWMNGQLAEPEEEEEGR